MAQRLAEVKRRGVAALAAIAAIALIAAPAPASAVARRQLRFGIDPELAGSAGSAQNPAKPVSQAQTLRALRALRPKGKQLVLRVNRLLQSDGEHGIRRFRRIIDRYTRDGFDTELQRYHPSAAEAGDIAAWTRYVRHVVDVFGSNRHLLAMTITNEVNLTISPNTSDGAFPNAEHALVEGIIAAHREAVRRGYRQLRFGFTFAYRYDPATDAEMFTGLRRGGAEFRRALGFVGVDYYPELVAGRATPIPEATTQMMATMRHQFLPLAGLGSSVPLWITESGYDTAPGPVTPLQQQRELVQIVDTVRRGAARFGVADYRWFNLRDNVSTTSAFAETTGLLTDAYRRKPAFAAYRSLIARYGVSR